MHGDRAVDAVAAVTLQDATSPDVDQLYAKLGSPPTPVDYDASSSGGSADPQLLVPSAAPGTWYILVYAASVPAASSFTITATGTPIQLTTVEPTQAPAGSTATLTLTGSGFNSTTTVSLVPMAGSPHQASSVTLDTFTQLTATFNLTGVPQGVYSVVVNNPGGSSSELVGQFTVTARAEWAMLVTHLILPAEMGRHVSSTIYVEYSNTGTAAMPAPLLVLESARPQDCAAPHAQPRAGGLGLLDLGDAGGLLALGRDPGQRQAGSGLARARRVGHGAGLLCRDAAALEPRRDELPVQACSLHPEGQKLNDWSSVEASLQPPGISSQAWSAIFAGLQSEIGPTIGDYVTMLDNEATYLGQLGENVTDVSQLWSLAVMQADGLTPDPSPGERRRS